MDDTVRKKKPAGPDAIFTSSARRLRTAAKACRVNKGGMSCAVLDVAAALIDNAQSLSQALGDDGGNAVAPKPETKQIALALPTTDAPASASTEKPQADASAESVEVVDDLD